MALEWTDGRPEAEKQANPLPPRALNLVMQITQEYEPAAQVQIFSIRVGEEGSATIEQETFVITSKQLAEVPESVLIHDIKRNTNKITTKLCEKIAKGRPYKLYKRT